MPNRLDGPKAACRRTCAGGPGQAVVWTIKGDDNLGAAADHELRVEATIVETGEELIAMDASHSTLHPERRQLCT